MLNNKGSEGAANGLYFQVTLTCRTCDLGVLNTVIDFLERWDTEAISRK